MVKDILGFLRELAANNNREWFHANKERYDALKEEHEGLVRQLIGKIALFDPEVAGLEAKDCVFRIYRDIRFSPDKRPYKNHIGAYICKGGKNSRYSGYYWHLEPDNCLFSGGLWMPEPKLLKSLRQDIYDQMDEFIEILETPSFKADFPVLEGETLKRNPAGYPADFPHQEIIRHKDFCVSATRPESFFNQKDWPDQAASIFQKLIPFHRFLNYTVDEFTSYSIT